MTPPPTPPLQVDTSQPETANSKKHVFVHYNHIFIFFDLSEWKRVGFVTSLLSPKVNALPPKIKLLAWDARSETKVRDDLRRTGRLGLREGPRGLI